jgi:hypothetical protein
LGRLLLLTAMPVCLLGQTPEADQAEPSAKTWVDNRAAIEEALRNLKVVGEETVPVGVTKPKKMELEPGGPVSHFAFKNVPPGRHGGFWESWKSEVAAYELDKLLDLNMVPPTVEKRVKGELGAAIMWCAPVKSFREMGGVPQATQIPGRFVAEWTRQMARAKMFDNLIGNKDPNLGNWLVDPAWNLILIDKTRAFTSEKTLVHKSMSNVDMPLWEKMQALTQETLESALGKWLGRGEIRAILDRRAKMKEAFDKLIAEKGDAVIIR